MSDFKEISPESLDFNAFKLIGKDWTLITAANDNKVNAMTASWGGVGVIWGKNVVYIFIRKSRYTKEFVDSTDKFSLAFFDHKKNSEMLSYMGKVSGRDENKIEKMGLTVSYDNDTPYFDAAETVLLCRKMCCQPLTSDNFTDTEVDSKWYADKDYHDMYIGEIEKVLIKK